MILRKIVLSNFRQFRDKQEIVFAPPGEKNVTVVHAENGFGKTALLNALHWGFWGKTTIDFSKPYSIITDHLATECSLRDTEASVEIWYSHQEEEFYLKRSLTLAQQRTDPKKTNIQLHKVVHGAVEQKPYKSSEYTIETHLPQAMGDMFFFNGENLDQLSLDKNAHQIKEAIFKVLGLELLESAELIAKDSVSVLSSELRKYSNDIGQSLIDNLVRCENELANLNTRKCELEKNLDAIEKDIKWIENELELNNESRLAQQRRRDIQRNIDSLVTHIADKEEEIGKFISSRGYYLFADDLVFAGRSAVQELERDGKIPAKFTSTVLQDIMDSGRCICSTDLNAHSECRQSIQLLIDAAADKSMDEAAQTIKSALSSLSAIDGYKDEFTELKDRYDELKRDRTQLENELNEVSRKIMQLDDEDAQNLEGQLEVKKEKGRECDREIANLCDPRIPGSIPNREKLRDSLNDQISAAEQSNDAAKRLSRQREATEHARKVMRDMINAEKEDLRTHLNNEISNEYSRIMLHDYKARLSSGFRLEVCKEIGSESQTVGLSTGQRQITSLVFIAALVKLARRRKEIPTIIKDLWGGDFPMVMDSPFGQLGDTYRGRIAKWLPTVAPQVVIFVSDSQWRGPVEESVEQKIGTEYILEYHAKELKSNASQKAVIRGNVFDQFIEDSEEFTKIRTI